MKKKTLFTLIILILFGSNYTIVSAKNLYFNEGKKLFDKKKYKDSKFYFEKDIVFNPKNENSYLYLAKIFNEEENKGFEENNLNTVLLLNPKNEEAIYLLTLLNIKNSIIIHVTYRIRSRACLCSACTFSKCSECTRSVVSHSSFQ